MTLLFSHFSFLRHQKNSQRLSQHSRTDKADLVASRISDQDYLEDKKKREETNSHKIISFWLPESVAACGLKLSLNIGDILLKSFNFDIADSRLNWSRGRFSEK